MSYLQHHHHIHIVSCYVTKIENSLMFWYRLTQVVSEMVAKRDCLFLISPVINGCCPQRNDQAELMAGYTVAADGYTHLDTNRRLDVLTNTNDAVWRMAEDEHHLAYE